MDNLTHALIGLVAAGVVVSARGERITPAFRNAAVWVSVAANNLPDLDFVYTHITAPPLGYLLHHRGHTHTLLAALPALGLLLLATRLLCAQVHAKLNRADYLWLSLLAFSGHLLHLAFDFSNNYGVHPFWPLDKRWYYGDSIFIVEPWLFVASVPYLWFWLKSRLMRLLLSLILLIIVGLCWLMPFVASGTAWCVSCGALLTSGLAYFLSRKSLPIASALHILLVVLTFASLGQHAKTSLQKIATQQFPNQQTIDTAFTPNPGNPVCWSALLVQTQGDNYFIRRAVLSLMPRWIPASHCPSEFDQGLPGAPYTALPASQQPELVWRGVFSATARDFAQLWHRDCDVRALMHFVRIPYWVHNAQGPNFVGDARYDRHPGRDFADLELRADPQQCPAYVPDWVEPRSAWLRAIGAQ